MIFYAFFSYAHADAELDPELFKAFSVELEGRVTQRLTNAQVKIWRDIQELRTGEQWDARIEDALRASHLLIVMLSPKWLESEYCRKEYQVFQEVEKKLPSPEFVFPLVVVGVEEEKDFLDAVQRQIFESLNARQHKQTLVDKFLGLTKDQRSALVAEIAADVKKRVDVLRRAEAAKPAAPPLAAPARPPASGYLGGLLGSLAGSLIGTASVGGGALGASLGRRDAAAKKPENLPPHNLPLASIGQLFMGRDAFMTSLAEALEKGNAVVAHGMGGVGKTRLAIEYAWRRAQEHTALLFVSAETPESLNAGLAALASVLKLPEQESPQDPVKIAAALGWLESNKNWLLILDNVDDARAADAVKTLLPKLANGKVIVTARYDKFDAAIRSLPLGVLSPDASRAFLLARTEGRRRAQDDDSARAAEVAKDLGFLALALEQAGAYVATRRISLERYLTYWREERARVEDWFDKSAMATNRDYGLAAAWRTSVDQLTPQGRRLLERVAFLAPEPIPEFLLDVEVPSSFETAPSGPPQDEGTGPNGPHAEEARPTGPHAEERPQAASRSTRAVPEPFDAREALADLYAYSLAAPAEIEGRYTQPAFAVHRLVQDFARNSMSEERRAEMLREALAWMNAAFVGDAGDVRDWPKLDPLAVHAKSVAEAADAANIAEPTARLMNAVGALFDRQARFHEAEPLYRRSLEIDEARFEPDHSDVGTALNNLGDFLRERRQFDEAERLLRRAVNIAEANEGADQLGLARSVDNLAKLLFQTDRHEEAEQQFRRSLSIVEMSHGQNHPDVALHANNLANLLLETDRLDEAEILSRRALAIRQTHYGPDHLEVAYSLNNLARFLFAAKRFTEAEPLFRRSLTIVAASLERDHPLTGTAVHNYRQILVELGAGEDEAEEKIAEAMRGE